MKHWPGLHFGKTLLEDRSILAGTWVSRTEAYRIKNRGETVRRKDITSTHQIPLKPLPCWKHLTHGEYCKEVRNLVREIEEEAALERKLAGTEVVGARAVLERDPETAPEATAKSYAPRVHAYRPTMRDEFLAAYSWFAAQYRDAAIELREGNLAAAFPEGSFPPGLPYVGDCGLPPAPSD